MRPQKEAESITSYVDRNPIATLGTINADGTPHGAVVYVCADAHKKRTIYFLTKTETTKFRNLSADNRVSITIVDPVENSTLQADGTAFEVEDSVLIDIIMDKLIKRKIFSKDRSLPLTKIRGGAYIMIGVNLEDARLGVFEGKSIGDAHLFTQL
jgi:general stress protein 26